MTTFVTNRPARCFLCNSVFQSKQRTGPDGYGTLCCACQTDYLRGRVPIYWNTHAKRYTVIEQENGRVFEVCGFELGTNGKNDLRKPVVREIESEDAKAFLRSRMKRILEERCASPRFTKGQRYSETESHDTSALRPWEYDNGFQYGVNRPQSTKMERQNAILKLLEEDTGMVSGDRIVSDDRISLKAFFRLAGRKVVRRFSIEENCSMTELHSVVDKLFGTVVSTVCYRDDENDVVTMSTENELAEMIKVAKRMTPVPVTLLLLSDS